MRDNMLDLRFEAKVAHRAFARCEIPPYHLEGGVRVHVAETEDLLESVAKDGHWGCI